MPNQHPLLQKPINCSGCDEPIKATAFCCARCDFALDFTCALIPLQIRHSAHPAHPLALLPKPTYASDSFACDACGLTGRAFSMHCEACTFDLHVRCACLLLSVTHEKHAHELVLVREPPEDRALTFSCDLCGNTVDRNYWVYRCNACDFDAHTDCATGEARRPVDELRMLTHDHQMVRYGQQVVQDQMQMMINTGTGWKY